MADLGAAMPAEELTARQAPEAGGRKGRHWLLQIDIQLGIVGAETVVYLGTEWKGNRPCCRGHVVATGKAGLEPEGKAVNTSVDMVTCRCLASFSLSRLHFFTSLPVIHHAVESW